jgi:hypothetical protein
MGHRGAIHNFTSGPLKLRRELRIALGLGLLALVIVPSGSSAAQLDTATATGASGPVTPPIETHFGLVRLFDINVDAHSGTAGQDPGGAASFTFGVPSIGGLVFSGPVTCLSVTGPDRGGGTPTAPTGAVLRFQEAATGILVAVALVDNGGNGADTITFAEGTAPGPGCSVQVLLGPETGTLTNGRAVVFDAPVEPAFKEECKQGGWRNFPQFKNQGECVSSVATG